MDTTSYRKTNKSSQPISLMREFYYDYSRMNRNRQKKQILPQQNRQMKTSSAFRMTEIINRQLQVEKIPNSLKAMTNTKSNDMGRSYFFKLRSRKQMEDYDDHIKGQFKNDYAQKHEFIRPYLSIQQRETKNSQQGKLFDTMKIFYESSKFSDPKNNRKELEFVKRKMESAQMMRKQISANLRYNYLLKTKYRQQTQQQMSQHTSNRINQFYKTKQNIFPDWNA